MTGHPLPIATWLLIFTIWPALAQDAENGAEVFKKCRTCHQVGDTAKIKLTYLVGVRSLLTACGDGRFVRSAILAQRVAYLASPGTGSHIPTTQ